MVDDVYLLAGFPFCVGIILRRLRAACTFPGWHAVAGLFWVWWSLFALGFCFECVAGWLWCFSLLFMLFGC